MNEVCDIILTILTIGLIIVIICWLSKINNEEDKRKEERDKQELRDSASKHIQSLKDDIKQKQDSIINCDKKFDLNLDGIKIHTYYIEPCNTDTAQDYSIKSQTFKKVRDKLFAQTDYADFNAFISELARECFEEGLTLKKVIQKSTKKETSGYTVNAPSTSSVGFAMGRSGITPVLATTGGSSTYIPSTTEHYYYDDVVDETFEDVKNRIREFYYLLLSKLVEDIVSSTKEQVVVEDDKISYYNALLFTPKYSHLHGWREYVLDIALLNIYGLNTSLVYNEINSYRVTNEMCKMMENFRF